MHKIIPSFKHERSQCLYLVFNLPSHQSIFQRKIYDHHLEYQLNVNSHQMLSIYQTIATVYICIPNNSVQIMKFGMSYDYNLAVDTRHNTSSVCVVTFHLLFYASNYIISIHGSCISKRFFCGYHLLRSLLHVGPIIWYPMWSDNTPHDWIRTKLTIYSLREMAGVVLFSPIATTLGTCQVA